MKYIFLLKAYLKFLFNSKSRYQIHSPFIYNFLTKVIKNKKEDSEYQKVKDLRAELRRNKEILNIEDFGAGTRDHSAMKIQRSISEIARRTSVQNKFAKMLFRCINHFQPKTILEFGTSLGLSSVLFALAAPKAKVYTMEGSVEILQEAEKNFQKLKLSNIWTIKGNFDDILPKKLEELKKLDFVFFDGNHQKEPTIDYFEKCLPYKHNDSIFVFDDIHWSTGMQEAWEYIKAHPETIVTIDLFFMGIVFFKKELSKEEFMYKL